MIRKASILSFVVFMGACAPSEESGVGYLSFSAPELRPLATDEEQVPVRWTVTVGAEDMAEPIVQRLSERIVTLEVPAGRNRLVSVFGEGQEVNELTRRGYAGLATAHVRREGESTVDVEVHRALRVQDDPERMARTRDGEDAPDSPDISGVTILHPPGSLQLVLHFANAVAAPWASGPNSLRGSIELDLDRSGRTGEISRILDRRELARDGDERETLGVDARIDLAPPGVNQVRWTSGDQSTAIPARWVGNALYINVPERLIEPHGDVANGIRMVILASDRTGAVDFLPEQGVIDTSLTPTLGEVPLAPVTGFEGSRIATVSGLTELSYPAIAAGINGIHLGWTTARGLTYIHTRDGRYIDQRNDVDWDLRAAGLEDYPEDRRVSMAVNTQGRPTLALSGFDYVQWAGQYTGILQGSRSGLSPMEVLLLPTDGFSQEGNTSSIVTRGDTSYVLHWAGRGAFSDAEVVSVTNGSLDFRQTLDVSAIWSNPFRMILANGADQSLVVNVSGYSEMGPDLWSTSGATSRSNVAFGAFEVASLSPEDALPVYSDFDPLLYERAPGAVPVHVFANVRDIGIVEGSSASRIVASTDLAAPGEILQLSVAASASGRLGIAFVIGEPPMGDLIPQAAAPSADSDPGVFYIERLPNASSFGPVMRVGNGQLAGVAFTASERPVILTAQRPCPIYEPCDSTIRLHRGR